MLPTLIVIVPSASLGNLPLIFKVSPYVILSTVISNLGTIKYTTWLSTVADML